MFSICSELTPRAPIPDTRIPQLMQPWRTKDILEDQKAEGPKNLIVLEVKGTKQLGGHTKFKKQEEDIN